MFLVLLVFYRYSRLQNVGKELSLFRKLIATLKKRETRFPSHFAERQCLLISSLGSCIAIPYASAGSQLPDDNFRSSVSLWKSFSAVYCQVESHRNRRLRDLIMARPGEDWGAELAGRRWKNVERVPFRVARSPRWHFRSLTRFRRPL